MKLTETEILINDFNMISSNLGTYTQRKQCKEYILNNQYKEAIDVLYDILDDNEFDAMMCSFVFEDTRSITTLIDKLEKLC